MKQEKVLDSYLGDFREKIDPYLRPLYDALDDMIPSEKLQNYIDPKRVIEIVPLAYMRGRTLNNAYVILDEAQNSTTMQMKMFLTRLGGNSKSIITGDITQIDLPAKQVSGLVQAREILSKVEGVAFAYFDKGDVVRHKLVKDIIDAYEKFNNNKNGNIVIYLFTFLPVFIHFFKIRIRQFSYQVIQKSFLSM